MAMLLVGGLEGLQGEALQDMQRKQTQKRSNGVRSVILRPGCNTWSAEVCKYLQPTAAAAVDASLDPRTSTGYGYCSRQGRVLGQGPKLRLYMYESP